MQDPRLAESDIDFEQGVKLGAGAAVGFTSLSLLMGLTLGALGFIYQKVTGDKEA